MIRKAFKYRLYPTQEQIDKLQWTLDRCRELYNAALDERKSAAPRSFALHVCGTVAVAQVEEKENYPRNAAPEKKRGLVILASKTRAHHPVSKYSQSHQLTEIKHELRPEYQQINDHILRNVLDRVEKAFDGFFRRCKAGQTPGYPRFQGKGRYDSLTTDNGFKIKACTNPKFALMAFQYIGELRMRIHRPIEGTIKTCTIKREGNHWYVIFSCEVEVCPQPASIDEIVGIDVGVNHYAALSTGEMLDNPRYYRQTEEKLVQAQQVLSRKQQPHGNPKGKAKGKQLSRRQKALRHVARLHRKVARQRRDFLHKQSRRLVNTYDTLVFEELQVANMKRRPKPKQDEDGMYLPNGASAKAGLNKSISDAGWAMFVEFCTYKAAWAGRAAIKVPPKNTSQICSGCGADVPKPLEERVHSCPHCGVTLDRDHNAAINIRTVGLSLIEARSPVLVEQDASQQKNEAGSASAFALAPPPKRRKSGRAADSCSLPLASQAPLWDGS